MGSVGRRLVAARDRHGERRNDVHLCLLLLAVVITVAGGIFVLVLRDAPHDALPAAAVALSSRRLHFVVVLLPHVITTVLRLRRLRDDVRRGIRF